MPPGIRGNGAGGDEARSRRRVHAILDGAGGMTQQGFEHFVTDACRADPPDRGEVVWLVGVLRDGRGEPQRKRATPQVAERRPGGGRHARRCHGTHGAAGRPCRMPDREGGAHDAAPQVQIHAAARGSLHQGQLVMEGAALLLEGCHLHPLRDEARCHGVLQFQRMRERRLGTLAGQIGRHQETSSRRPARIASRRSRSALPVTSGFQSRSTSARARAPRATASAGLSTTWRISRAA